MASGQEARRSWSLRFTRTPFPSHRASRAPPSNRTARDHHRELGEFILPYEAVRSSAAPELAIMEFVDSTYARAATLANWDRAALETNPRASRGGDDR